MKKILIRVCHEHARVYKWGKWYPYVEALEAMVLQDEPFELVVQSEKCDLCTK